MGLFEKLKKNKNAKIVEQKFPFYDEPNTAAIRGDKRCFIWITQ